MFFGSLIGERAKRASHTFVMLIEIRIYGTSIASGHAPIVDNMHAHTFV